MICSASSHVATVLSAGFGMTIRFLLSLSCLVTRQWKLLWLLFWIVTSLFSEWKKFDDNDTYCRTTINDILTTIVKKRQLSFDKYCHRTLKKLLSLSCLITWQVLSSSLSLVVVFSCRTLVKWVKANKKLIRKGKKSKFKETTTSSSSRSEMKRRKRFKAKLCKDKKTPNIVKIKVDLHSDLFKW